MSVSLANSTPCSCRNVRRAAWFSMTPLWTRTICCRESELDGRSVRWAAHEWPSAYGLYLSDLGPVHSPDGGPTAPLARLFDGPAVHRPPSLPNRPSRNPGIPVGTTPSSESQQPHESPNRPQSRTWKIALFKKQTCRTAARYCTAVTPRQRKNCHRQQLLRDFMRPCVLERLVGSPRCTTSTVTVRMFELSAK